MSDYAIRTLTVFDYDAIFALWNSTEQTRRALNPVDDSRDGIVRYLRRNPHTCFGAFTESGQLAGVILSGHDGRRGLVHHLCVHPDFRKQGIAQALVAQAEKSLQAEGIQKIFCLVFTDNDGANVFWEKQGYTVRKNICYRNKSLHRDIPTGE